MTKVNTNYMIISLSSLFVKKKKKKKRKKMVLNPNRRTEKSKPRSADISARSDQKLEEYTVFKDVVSQQRKP